MSAPRWTRALLARMAEPDRRAEVLGDLDEAHAIRRTRHGRLIASVLTSLEALDMVLALRWQGRRGLHRILRTVPRDLTVARRRRMPPMSWLDFKLGLRMLARYPGMTVVGGAAMALGIAIGAGGLHLLSELVYPSRPYAQPERIVGLRNVDTRTARSDMRAIHDLERWRDALSSVEHIGALRGERLNFAPEGALPAPVVAVSVSASAFEMAPSPPLLGRPLLSSDEAPDAPPVVLLSHWLWQSRFAGDPDVVGRIATVGSETVTVVGVMPEEFRLDVPSNDIIYPFGQDLWRPFRARAIDYPEGEGPAIDVFGQLAAGASLEEARAELATLSRVAAAEFPESHAHLRTELLTFGDPFAAAGPSRGTLVSLSSIFVSLVMIMLCANVALLMYARTATREAEIVVRSALGASRARIVAQLLTEASALATVATAVGLVGAGWGVRWVWGVLSRIAEFEGARWHDIDVTLGDTSVMVAVALAFVGAVVAGVLPGLKITQRCGVGLSRHASRAGAAPLGRVWSGILIAQVGLTTMILPVTALVGRYAWNGSSGAMGPPTGDYLSVTLEMDGDARRGAGLDERDFMDAYTETVGELTERLAGEAGVAGVTLAERLPGYDHRRWVVEVEDGQGAGTAEPAERAQITEVDPAFFDVMGGRLVGGRWFVPNDFQGETDVVIANETFVERFLGGANAVGRRIRYQTSRSGRYWGPPESGGEPPWLQIVGVVEDLQLYGGATLVSNAGLYHPLRSDTYPVQLALHLPSGPADFAPHLREVARDVAPELRLLRPIPMARANEVDELALSSTLLALAFIGGFAILLTNAGIYAIVSFTVQRRTREIGVRVALGADRAEIIAAVLSRIARLVTVGVVVGGTAGLGLAYLMAEGTVQPSATLWSLAGLFLIAMVAICMAACVVPTRRALAIEPTEALAAEG